MAEVLDIRSPALHDLIEEAVDIEQVAGGFGFTEGPVWRGDELLFSDIRKNRIVRWRQLREGPEVTTLCLGRSNGLTLDLRGELLAAEHGGRRVSRIARDGGRTALVERYQGLRLNSPNDLVVKSDGSTLTLLADDFALPNGLAFSPDEKTLYIDDSERRHIRAFDVEADGSLTNGRVLLEMASPDSGVPDGMKVDAEGNIFCTGPGGIWVCRPSGELLGRILLPEQPANLAWGDDWCTLFVTARTSVYRICTQTEGLPLS